MLGTQSKDLGHEIIELIKTNTVCQNVENPKAMGKFKAVWTMNKNLVVWHLQSPSQGKCFMKCKIVYLRNKNYQKVHDCQYMSITGEQWITKPTIRQNQLLVRKLFSNTILWYYVYWEMMLSYTTYTIFILTPKCLWRSQSLAQVFI